MKHIEFTNGSRVVAARSCRFCYAVVMLLVVACAPLRCVAAEDAVQQFDVRLHNREVVEPEGRRLIARQGSTVEIRWRSDEVGELHLEGYDIEIRLREDFPVLTRFVARASGRFPVVSHGFAEQTGHAHGHRALLYVEVHPD